MPAAILPGIPGGMTGNPGLEPAVAKEVDRKRRQSFVAPISHAQACSCRSVVNVPCKRFIYLKTFLSCSTALISSPHYLPYAAPRPFPNVIARLRSQTIAHFPGPGYLEIARSLQTTLQYFPPLPFGRYLRGLCHIRGFLMRSITSEMLDMPGKNRVYLIIAF